MAPAKSKESNTIADAVAQEYSAATRAIRLGNFKSGDELLGSILKKLRKDSGDRIKEDDWVFGMDYFKENQVVLLAHNRSPVRHLCIITKDPIKPNPSTARDIYLKNEIRAGKLDAKTVKLRESGIPEAYTWFLNKTCIKKDKDSPSGYRIHVIAQGAIHNISVRRGFYPFARCTVDKKIFAERVTKESFVVRNTEQMHYLNEIYTRLVVSMESDPKLGNVRTKGDVGLEQYLLDSYPDATWEKSLPFQSPRIIYKHELDQFVEVIKNNNSPGGTMWVAKNPFPSFGLEEKNDPSTAADDDFVDFTTAADGDDNDDVFGLETPLRTFCTAPPTTEQRIDQTSETERKKQLYRQALNEAAGRRGRRPAPSAAPAPPEEDGDSPVPVVVPAGTGAPGVPKRKRGRPPKNPGAGAEGVKRRKVSPPERSEEASAMDTVDIPPLGDLEAAPFDELLERRFPPLRTSSQAPVGDKKKKKKHPKRPPVDHSFINREGIGLPLDPCESVRMALESEDTVMDQFFESLDALDSIIGEETG